MLARSWGARRVAALFVVGAALAAGTAVSAHTGSTPSSPVADSIWGIVAPAPSPSPTPTAEALNDSIWG
jgi:hypothetical protein